MSEGSRPIVDRCVCTGLTFEALRDLARRKGLDFDGLRREAGCGDGCGLCEPYVRAMLATGETRLPLIDAPERRAAGPGATLRNRP